MIITRIDATDVLRYRELRLENLPEQGLIAISGPNESGKSSIGEVICFALFGRTFSLPPGRLGKFVRWGQGSCSVELDFKTSDGHYRVTRELDRDGNQSAKLLQLDGDQTLARGAERVSAQIIELIGFDYEEYIESFYLAQREITTPHPHSHAVKIMAGIEPLAQVSETLRNEIDDRRELREELQVEIDAALEESDGLGHRQGETEQLEAEETQWQRQVVERRDLRQALQQGMDVCLEKLPRAMTAAAGARRFSSLRTLLLLLALLLGTGWWLLARQSQLGVSVELARLVADAVPGWQAQQHVIWLGYAAAGALLLALLFWVAAAGRRGRARSLLQEARGLGDDLQRVRELPEVPDVIADDGDYEYVEWDDAAQDWREVEFDALDAARPDSEDNLRLHTDLEDGSARAADVRTLVTAEVNWLDGQIHRLSRRLALLQDQLEVARDKADQAKTLNDVLTALWEQQEKADNDISVRERALELLTGASRDLSARFSREVRERVAGILPVFTGGRYEHLNIDDELNVRVFSNDKRDFMGLDEVSSGTQRQIMLALRLSLSQQLMKKLVRGVQYTFLDEPFAFFDQARMRKAIEALDALRSSIGQVWLVAQSYPGDIGLDFSVVLSCEPGQESLVHA